MLDGFVAVLPGIVMVSDDGEDVVPATVPDNPRTPTPPYGRVEPEESKEVALPTKTTVGVTHEVRVAVKTGVMKSVVVAIETFGVIVIDNVVVDTEAGEELQ